MSTIYPIIPHSSITIADCKFIQIVISLIIPGLHQQPKLFYRQFLDSGDMCCCEFCPFWVTQCKYFCSSELSDMFEKSAVLLVIYKWFATEFCCIKLHPFSIAATSVLWPQVDQPYETIWKFIYMLNLWESNSPIMVLGMQ